ncbi:MAG: EamA family transporter [Candidatus Aminicenantes bacterium]|nr:EamA family transporter [Candidatus Aminicenantes bacterium]
MNFKKSLLEIHAAVLLFGLAGLFAKWLLFSPFVIVFGRVVFASLSLGIIIHFSGIPLSCPKGQDRILFILIGILLTAHWTFFFKSIQVSSVAVGLLAYSTFPVFTTFLEPLFFKERLIKGNILLAFLCLIGVFFIIPTFSFSDKTFQGVFWGLLAGLSFAILTIFNRSLSQRYSSLVISFYQNALAAILLIPFIFTISFRLNIRSLVLLAFLGIICTAFSHTLFIKGMKHVRAQTASIISALEPVYGILLALFLLKEIPSYRTILGGIVILGAVLGATCLSTRKIHKNVI